MGLDCRLMVLAEFSDKEDAFVSDILALRRDEFFADLENRLEASTEHWGAIQLPAGDHASFQDGREFEGSDELGWLTGDPYGSVGFKSLTGAQLKELMDEKPPENQYNKSILSFMTKVFKDRHIVVYFH